MELLQLRYFLTVARTLNISHAAKHHMIPQPAMSKTISRLEKELGTPLFYRYKNKLSLTDEGVAFYRSVSLSLSRLDNAVLEMRQTDAPLSGTLKILVRQHRSTIVDCIMAFKRLYPQVSFQISYEQDTADLQDFDLCISCDQPDETFSSSSRLITEQLKLVVPATHPAASSRQVRFQTLQQEEFATISQGSNLWQQTLLQCRQAGFEPRVSITCSDLHCLIKYIGAGMAITLGPEIAWKDLCDDSIAFVPTEPELFRSTYVFWSRLKTPSRLNDVFRDFMVTYFQMQVHK
ncbi:MAG: LysR family transcriptional regulator [Oscillospiraceae bacterium]|nr:LysR family transcriptional regulator [Oscillospiraceae bacterium]